MKCQEFMTEWTQKQKDPHIASWLAWLDKLTGPIQKKKVTKSLKELEDEAKVEQTMDQLQDSRKQKRDSEEEE